MNFVQGGNGDTIIFGYSPNNEINFSRILLPTDLPNLQVWLDANEGALNAIGVPIALVSVVVSGASNVYSDELDEEKDINGTYSKSVNSMNGRNSYANGLGDFIYWNGVKWTIEAAFDDGGGGEIFVYEHSDGQDVNYPFEATWNIFGQGASFQRANPENDAAATNNQTVTQWNNKAPGKPNLSQTNTSLRPVFKSDIFGRKTIGFTDDILHNSGFSNFVQEYSYYFVSTSLVSTSAGDTAIKLTPNSSRGSFGAHFTTNTLIAYNGSAVFNTNLSRSISNNFGVFSARFNLSAGQVTVGRNLIKQTGTVSDTTSAATSTIIIGGRNTTSSTLSIDSNFSEILVYDSFHDDNTAQQIINYLVQKWNIDTSL